MNKDFWNHLLRFWVAVGVAAITMILIYVWAASPYFVEILLGGFVLSLVLLLWHITE